MLREGPGSCSQQKPESEMSRRRMMITAGAIAFAAILPGCGSINALSKKIEAFGSTQKIKNFVQMIELMNMKDREKLFRIVLKKNNVKINRERSCSENEWRGCTSTEGFKLSTLYKIIELAKDCHKSNKNCEVIVTGGSEDHQLDGRGKDKLKENKFSHKDGNKVDYYADSNLNKYFVGIGNSIDVKNIPRGKTKGILTRKGSRGESDPVFEDDDENIYVLEFAEDNSKKHWDVSYKKECVPDDFLLKIKALA